MGWRLVDVSPDGRVGVAAHALTRSRRRVDLEHLVFETNPVRGRLARDKRWVEVTASAVRVSAVDGGDAREYPLPPHLAGQVERWQLSSSGGALCALSRDRVMWLAPIGDEEPRWTRRPAAPDGVQTLAFDDESGLVMTGWPARARLETIDARAEPVELAWPTGDVKWVGVGRLHAYAVVKVPGILGSHGLLHAWSTRRPHGHVASVGFAPVWGEPEAYACTSDGNHAAVGAYTSFVILLDARTGDSQSLGGHSDAIHLVRFCDGDRLLITADRDNRVILRPRDGEGYATRLVEAPFGSRG